MYSHPAPGRELQYWDPVKAAAAGGKTFPSPVPLSHYRLSHFFLGVPKAGPGTNLS
jgi:hypothetical protein